MRKLVIILVACALASLPVLGYTATESRLALVIGNGAYKNAPLRNPVNDATDIGRTLKRLGFQVTILRDASQRKMEDAIRSFGKELANGGVGLFYYAGHGMQVNGRNYLIPVDARIESPSDVQYESIDAGRVLGKMEDAGNNMNIVILDACRDNPFSRSWRSGHRGLARMDAPKGSFIAYATAPGSVAADGDGRNGVYTSNLLKYMNVPGLEIGKMFREVRVDVVKASGNKQTPWESSSLMGDFYFTPKNTSSANSDRAVNITKRQTPQNLNAEEELWEIVKTSTAIEDFQMFLDEYPDSRFSTHAKLKIQQLMRMRNAKAMTASVSQNTIDESNSGERRELLNRYKLALFPVKVVGSSEEHDYRSKLAINIVSGICKKEDKLDFKLSYKLAEGITNSTQLFLEKMSKEERQVWKKDSVFAPFEPDWGKIEKIGKSIDADLALLILIRPGSGANVDVHLFDYKEGKSYSRTHKHISYNDYPGGIRQNVIEAFDNFFEKQ
jgi:hypothetical protein